jgi:hypothetical protein
MNAVPGIPFPRNPAVGDRWQNWVWNGSRWVCSPGGFVLIRQVFLANAIYQPSIGLISGRARTRGGGGGGGAAGPSPLATYITGGGGGGSGSQSELVFPASLVLGGVTVNIGLGGAGGLISPIAAQGSPGGTTSFGALCSAPGGLGGFPAHPGTAVGEPGPGGPRGVGDFTTPGSDGAPGINTQVVTGFAQIVWSGRGGQLDSGGHATDIGPGGGVGGRPGDANTGAGGGGALFNADPTGAIYEGAFGGSGFCLVDEYCWIEPGSEGCCPDEVGQARVAWPSGHRRGFDPFGEE